MRARRPISGLGLLLVLSGAVLLLLTVSPIARFWPLVIVAVGLIGLVRRPGWLDELDLVLPGVARAADRPRRLFSWVLIATGMLLLVISLGLIPQRLVGAALLVALGALLIWRRSR